MTMSEKYCNEKPIAVLATSVWGGLVVLDVEKKGYCDVVVVGLDNGMGYGFGDIAKHKVYTTATGRAYICKYGERYYLDNFSRVY